MRRCGWPGRLAANWTGAGPGGRRCPNRCAANCRHPRPVGDRQAPPDGWPPSVTSIRGLRHDLVTGTSELLAGRLASIARQVADVAAASASQRERQAGERLADPEAEEAGLRALRDLAAAPSQVAAVRGWLRPEHFAARQPWRAVRGHGRHG